MQKEKDKEDYQGNLLAKASAKMIQTYNDRLTEMMLDDILLDTVNLLQVLISITN